MSLIKKIINSNKLEKIKINTEISGVVRGLEGSIVETDGFPASVGSVCEIESLDAYKTSAEVIGFRNNKNLIALHKTDTKLKVGSRVKLVDEGVNIDVGNQLLGRVIDGMGYPLDGKPLGKLKENWPLNGKAVNPLERKKIDTAFDVGVRSINSIITIGKGQRIGIIAGSGVGKSVLLQMMSKYSNSDVVVVGLIGERAREVKIMVESLLSYDKNNKIIIVAVPADRSPLLRMRGANRCTAIAEYFRSKGKNVLLIMDSLTRVAHAKREIGLALGEQPTSKGYPPSVISMIPALIERAGSGNNSEGNITAFYTVLADSDDHNDPVVDSARAILDGHIILSREQAQLGIYPAIDIQNSISRVMDDIVPEEHKKLSRELKRIVSVYKESRDLVLMGGYSKGQDKSIDDAHQIWPKIVEFMKQDSSEKDTFEGSYEKLKGLLENSKQNVK
ncbi:MAG: Flagellum-specific ATP synthase [Alphaproteobacteria bacterium MarineAlpha9_Bin4]|nr:flagellum-specific ATP synthase FliI [Pelagibacterales bacterium]PPR26883.1 MAG: Flagellum-specific ATP synthase [Alphaproteobacteria bacterium MarineAlpha9_Bin4]|tara:strand:+ start:421 stop:1761 length:1341 start_codon:yes stop_codon:yes gene_type:complete